ncbi:MAG: glycosyltransferase [Candidatus Acidiferrales bacterium]
MHILWTVYFGLDALCSIIGAALCGLGLRQLPWLKRTEPLRSDHAPSISIIFAARDEAEKLAKALPTLLDQNYPDYEVLAVNDRSRDATLDILNQFARASKRLRVLDVTELPPGWLGKTHALDAGYHAARGEWLVFTDADVSFSPDVLSRAMALATERGWDHLTLLAGIEMHGVWEIAAVSYFGLVFVAGNGIWHTNRPNSRAYNGVGAFQLVRREAYERAGGHKRLALDVIDDMKLGKIVKLAGFRSGTGIAFDEVRVRWQAGLRNVIAGVTKNMFAAVGYNAAFAGAAMMVPLAFSIGPLAGVILATGWARVFAGIALAAVLGMHGFTLASAGRSPLYALTNPIGAILFDWMLLRSTVVTLWQGGVKWRDTFYPLDELRKNMV